MGRIEKEAVSNNSEQLNQNQPTGWEGIEALAGKMGEQSEKLLTADNNVYREIAKNALRNWNGLSEAEAAERVAGADEVELEPQVGAISSIVAATDGIMIAFRQATIDQGIPIDMPINRNYDFDSSSLTDAVLNGHKTDKAFKELGEAMEKVENKEKFVLDVLDNIHTEWINDNEKKLNDSKGVQKRYQFLPMSLIGFKEAKADLLFLEPIMNAAGVEIDETKLESAYNDYNEGAREIKQVIRGELDGDEQIEQLEQWEDGKPVPEIAKDMIKLLNNRVGVDEKFALYDDVGVDFSNIEDKSQVEQLHSDGLITLREPTKSEQYNRYIVELARQVVKQVRGE